MKKAIVVTSVIALLIVSAIGIRVAMHFTNQVNEPSVTDALYSYKDTHLDDNSKTRTIVDLANISSYTVHSISLQTDEEPMRLTVNIKVDDRSKHRHIDYESLNKTSALIFALIPNADEISYLFYDDYSDINITETAFSGSYYNRNFMYERDGMEKFYSDYINGATQTSETFEKYYYDVMSITSAVQTDTVYDMINEFIGNDCEIVVNSGIAARIELNSGFSESEDAQIISYILDISFDEYAGKTVELLKQDIRNFKTNTDRKCAFVYYEEPQLGIVVIGAKYLDTPDDIAAIRQQIIKRN